MTDLSADCSTVCVCVCVCVCVHMHVLIAFSPVPMDNYTFTIQSREDTGAGFHLKGTRSSSALPPLVIHLPPFKCIYVHVVSKAHAY